MATDSELGFKWEIALFNVSSAPSEEILQEHKQLAFRDTLYSYTPVS